MQNYRSPETEKEFLVAKGFYDEISFSNLFLYKKNNPASEFFSKTKKNIVFLGGSSLRGCYPPLPLYKNLNSFKQFLPVFPDVLSNKIGDFSANFMNMAIGGFNSHTILKGLVEYQEFIQPGDIFIFYEGFNDKFVSFLNEKYEIDIYKVKLNYYINFLVRYSIFLRAIKFNFEKLKPWVSSIFRKTLFQKLFSPDKRDFLDAFKYNLQKMAKILNEKKAKFILTTQIANSCRHKIEYAHMVKNELLNYCTNFILENKILHWYYLLKCYSQLNANDKFYFHLILALEFPKRGISDSKKHFKIMNNKCIRDFYDLPTNKVIRAVARKNNIELVDFSEEFRKNHYYSTGYEYFVDEIHPNQETHQMLADILEPVLEKYLGEK